MNIAELHGDEALRRREFPVVEKTAFFAHAGLCPLPRRVADAMKNYVEASCVQDQEGTASVTILRETRERAAQLIGGKPEDVALVGPTSLALSLVASGLRIKRGQNVVVYQDDYPSNVYPWMALAERGVEVRFLNVRELGRLRTVEVIGQVDSATRLVALSSCHFIAGYRIDLDGMGKALRDRGILFCVDGIQTVGAFPTRVEHVDFLAADSHKWMLGPCAAGILYVKPSALEQVNSVVHGWNNLRCPDYVAREELEWRSGARRFEAGTHNWAGLVGMHAALGLLLEVGIENIAAELLRKRAWVVPELISKGWNVLYSTAGAALCGGMISFQKPGVDLAATHQRLMEQGVFTSLRTVRSGQKFLRISPHFYNTDAELRKLLELLP